MSGSQLGHYRVLEKIGKGGMGEVYRARDARLERNVAIKILPEAFVGDAERVARFQREAKVLASLNHPHIATIYGLEEAEGVTALVMELVEGEDLSQRLTRGPMPLDEVLPIANQIAAALEAAHGQGIVHRDLKPANIKVRPDGTVKVLDFGLARAVASDVGSSDLGDSPTVTAVATRAGTILGTVSYMSPEQAKGRAVDKRADIWAFGAVLYELLTGSRAFQGESVAEILSHVLTQPPNWSLLPAGTPAPIRTLLRRCLEKNPTRRLDSAVTLRLEIDDALVPPPGVTTADVSRAPRRRVSWQAIAAVLAASVITALGMWALTRPGPPAPVLPTRMTITFPPTEPMDLSFQGRDLAISPDGRYLAYQSRGRLMLRAFDQLDAVLLSSVTAGRTPFFSPDSRWIGFFDRGDLKKVSVTGEPVITVARGLAFPQGGAWGEDGTIVIASGEPRAGLKRVSADGGDVAEITEIDAGHQWHRSPSVLPGGRGVLFTMTTNDATDSQLGVLDLKSGEQKVLVPRGFAGTYLDAGHIVYAMVGSQGAGEKIFATLWVVGFDLDRLALRGEPVRVGDLEVDMVSAPNYAVSKSGALAYVPARARALSFVWVDRTGHETAVSGLPPRPYDTFGLSPDETRVAFSTLERNNDISVFDFARNVQTRLTFETGHDWLPRWTPDSRRIVFRSNRDGPMNLYSIASDGSGAAERLMTTSNDQYPNSITKDGFVLYCEARPTTGLDILRRPIATLAEATVLLSTPSAEYAANISPDGRYFAYQSTESEGRSAVYVRPYPDASKGRWQVSTGGGLAPVWSRSGTELFYLDDTNTLMAVKVDTSGPQFSPGTPAKVFDTRYSGDFYSYDVTRDGRFLMLKESGGGDAAHPPNMVVVLNWFEELKRVQGSGTRR